MNLNFRGYTWVRICTCRFLRLGCLDQSSVHIDTRRVGMMMGKEGWRWIGSCREAWMGKCCLLAQYIQPSFIPLELSLRLRARLHSSDPCLHVSLAKYREAWIGKWFACGWIDPSMLGNGFVCILQNEFFSRKSIHCITDFCHLPSSAS